ERGSALRGGGAACRARHHQPAGGAERGECRGRRRARGRGRPGGGRPGDLGRGADRGGAARLLRRGRPEGGLGRAERGAGDGAAWLRRLRPGGADEALDRGGAGACAGGRAGAAAGLRHGRRGGDGQSRPAGGEAEPGRGGGRGVPAAACAAEGHRPPDDCNRRADPGIARPAAWAGECGGAGGGCPGGGARPCTARHRQCAGGGAGEPRHRAAGPRPGRRGALADEPRSERAHQGNRGFPGRPASLRGKEAAALGREI
ncbi:MAG: Enoyl-CoA hydratase, partial [uncultured Craurococcus sp.]